MRESVVESLENQLAEARQQWQQAEEHGAEIAERAQTRIAELEARVEYFLSEGPSSGSTECKTCGFLLMVVAHLYSFCMFAIWFWCVRGDDPKNDLGNVVWLFGCFSPALLFWSSWVWKKFKRRHSWNAWNDNDYYNKLARWLEL